MNYSLVSVKKYADELAKGVPVPGGGSAAALAGVLGASLIEMACNFTLGSKSYKEHFSVVKKIRAVCSPKRKKLLLLVDKDAKAFMKYTVLREHRNVKNFQNKEQLAIKQMANVPFEVCVLCYDFLLNLSQLRCVCNKNLVVDLDVAKELLNASFNGSTAMINANVKYVKDVNFSKKMRKSVAMLEKDMDSLNRRLI